VSKEWDYSAFRQYVISHARKAGIAAKQADLARATEIDQTQLSRWFRGEAQPTVAGLRKLEAKVPGTTLHDMMVLTGHVQGDASQVEPTPRQSHPLVYELDDLLADDSPLPAAERDTLATLIDRIIAPYRTGRRRTA
jgi:transcriptional regulator with XRE-family HTH domain